MTSSAVQPIVALLSDMVGGNPTQYMIEKAFAHHNLDWRYLTVEVTPDDLADAVRGMRAMGFQGGHVGHHHKRAVIPMLDRTGDTAALVEAVNLILRDGDDLVGENTEGMGAVAAIGRVVKPAKRHVLVLGAGRVARAIGAELAAAGAAEINVADRDPTHAEPVAGMIAERFKVPSSVVPWDGSLDVPEHTDLLINATSIGREDSDAQLPINLDTLAAEMLVADVTADPPQTWLLREAEERGCKTVDGLSMYIEQIAIGFKLWTGIEPDCQVMREAIEEFLEL